MRLILLLLALNGVFLASAQPCPSDMRDLYRRWDSAYQRMDVDRLESMMHPRLRLIFDGGETRDRENYVLSLRASDPPAFYKTTVLKVRDDGWNRIVWTHEVSDDGDGHKHGHRYRDTWARHRGEWKMIESRTLWHG